MAKGVAMSPELLATLKNLHPDGVPETEIDALAARLMVRAGLRVVGGAVVRIHRPVARLSVPLPKVGPA